MPVPRAFHSFPVELTPLDRERLLRMAAEIEKGVALAEGAMPPPDISTIRAGAFGTHVPPARALTMAIESARDDAQFLRNLADRGRTPNGRIS